MTSHEDRVTEALGVVQGFEPRTTVVWKDHSRFHRAVGWLMTRLGNPDYLSGFWTTIGHEIGRPTSDRISPAGSWEIVLHEGVHVLAAKKWTSVLYGLAYMLPQALGILGPLLGVILAAVLWKAWPLWFLVAGLGLAPMPAPWRWSLELDAYRVSLAVKQWYSGSVPDYRIAEISASLAGPGYYYAWPWRASTSARLRAWVEEVRQGTARMDEYLLACRALAGRYKKEDGLG